MNVLTAALAHRAAQQPQSTVLDDGHEAVSAAALWHDVEQLAGVFRARGVRRLALLADNAPNWVRVDLAAQVAGVCLVPVPTFFSASQRAHVL
ncbi:MAG TPA: long-chain acyl-CoA synthetase, partial [Halieaceae bacterium]|nr:long-chain acyl-CoA synthetase [Halieaceae bacterium]